MPVFNKHLTSIFGSAVVIVLGILCFEVCIHLKFLGDAYKNSYAYLVMIGISVVSYTIFKKYVKRIGIIKNKYLTPKKISWQSKIGIITLALIIDMELSYPFPTHTENQNKIESSQKDMSLITLLLDGSISPAIIEEICFRGILFIVILASSSYLFKYKNCKNDWLGLLSFFAFSSIFFGFVHVAKGYDIQNIGGYLMSGFVFSFIYILTRDLKIPIMVHFLNNAIGILSRHNMNYLSILILYVLIFFGIYVLYIKRHKINGYGNYLYYRFKKVQCQKQLQKNAEKRSVLQ